MFIGISLNVTQSGVGGGAPPVPGNLTLPEITGPNNPPRDGDTLTCSTGTWSNTPTSYTYQWQFDSGGGVYVDIEDAEDAEFYIYFVGYPLRCVVTASNAGGMSVPAASAPTEIVIDVPQPEITTIDFTGIPEFWFVTEGPGKYFVISSATERIAVWFDTGTEVQPDASAQGATTYLPITVATDITPTDAAGSVVGPLGSNGFSASSLGAVATATDDTTGSRVDAVAATSGATVTVTQQGQ